MKNIILSCSFANEKVTVKSYQALYDTTRNQPCEVWVWDNHYPLNTDGFVRQVCMDYGFKYMHSGENVGMYEAYRRLIGHLDEFAKGIENVIFYDGDCNPKVNDWHLALLAPFQDEKVVHTTLINQTNNRELRERGFNFETINGIKCMVTQSACTNTVCAFNIPWLKAIGGLQGKYYYGGNEVAMWPEYGGKKWAFLADYWEDKEEMDKLHDWQYHQYKLLYAHKGMDISFAEYLKTDPEFIDNLEKHIFG